jgi:hypothetical protein
MKPQGPKLKMGSKAIGKPLAEIACSDCGAYGCLIPVPHKPA